MNSSIDLRNLLKKIDHKGYPAYKETRGKYDFGSFIFGIEHVQGDPFAAPSKVSIVVPGRVAKFDSYYYDDAQKQVAFEDYLLRCLAKVIRAYSFKAKGSGKSGLIRISEPKQEILKRSACTICEKTGDITVLLEIGFPANGRTINARELEKIIFDFLPECVNKTLIATAHNKNTLCNVVELAQDQYYIRQQLKELGLVAFVANGSILPRKSGVSALPMKDAVPFTSPKELEIAMELPHKGTLRGMGIKKGITLIVGGGYHGKSTLLKALELGVYNHIAGDGREYVITDETAMKLRAEDGRSIQNVDISMFIQNLPNGKDTKSFYTEDASGSTSQAANTVEAMEMGAQVFLIDEDTSATNFMIRDELMQRVVHKDVEPIIPFIDRIEELYEDHGISTVLVAGSSGSYFHKADTIIQMNRYEPMEITQRAKEEAAHFPLVLERTPKAEKMIDKRIVKHDVAFAKDNRIKTKTLGMDGISIQKETVDLRYVEQLVDVEQLNALCLIVKYMKLHMFDGKTTVKCAVEQLEQKIAKDGFSAFCEGAISGDMVLPRTQEIYATLNRCRGLLTIER